jgi:hypothetical protein
VAWSTAATANDALLGSTPMSTFMRAYLRFGRSSHPSTRAKDIATTSWRAHTSFERLRTPGTGGGGKPRTSQPTLRATGSSRAIPETGTLEA